jgi:F0F1-type ATP synthase membrane subunit b/b'
MMRRLRWIVPAAFLLVIAATPLLAAEGGDSAADSTIGRVFRWLNFIVVFGGGGYFIAKKAPAFFRGRAETIVSAITEASRVREEAERRCKEAETRLAGLEQEIAEMRATARRDAQADAGRIRALAHEEDKKIALAGDAEILAAERGARLELQALGAGLAIERAEAQLRKEITPSADAALFRGFVAQLEGGTN